MSSYTYDEVGRMVNKKIGNNVADITYSYNVRNWLTRISSSKFTEELSYTNRPNPGGSSVGLFNGNISMVSWKTPSSGMLTRSYGLQYDALGRLTNADYGEHVRGLSYNSGIYNESFIYDKNGNIRSLRRSGLKDDNTFGLIDNLVFSEYLGNKLMRIDEYVPNQNSSDLMEFKIGYIGTEPHYSYNNGKLQMDRHKQICKITYNPLSLPSAIKFRYGHEIEYVYDANGVKRRTIHKESKSDLNLPAYLSSITPLTSAQTLTKTTTDYVDNKVYVNEQLKMILTDEGYIMKEGTKYNYYYYLKDHLGNNRIVLNSSGGVVQETNYYPSGTTIADYPRRSEQGVQPYKYNGKELDRSHNMDFYDYEARVYDPAIMRFTRPDPLATKYYSWSEYVYCANNPIRYVDPTGMDIWEIDDAGRIIQRIKDKTQDAFYMVAKDADGNYQQTYNTDADGNVKFNSISFEYGTIESQRSISFSPDGQNVDTYDVYQIRGDDNGADLFEFMAANTTVEWSQAKTGIKGDKGLNFMTTSHDKEIERGMDFLYLGQLYNGYTIREMNHSHPSNTAYPSGSFVNPNNGAGVGEWGDVGFSRLITNNRQTNRLNVPTFNIYLPSNKSYIKYGPNSIRDHYGR